MTFLPIVDRELRMATRRRATCWSRVLVALGEFWRLMAVLLNTIFFSLAAGLLVSALARREQLAVFSTFLLVMATAYVLPALGSISKELASSNRFL